MAVLELRVALTTTDYNRLVTFFQEGLGVDPAQLWTTATTHATLYELGRGTVEVFDEAHAAMVDQLETDGRGTSGPIRFALEVPDVDAALERALQHGGTLVHAPVVTPWRDKNARILSPDGLHITLFQPLGPEE